MIVRRQEGSLTELEMPQANFYSGKNRVSCAETRVIMRMNISNREKALREKSRTPKRLLSLKSRRNISLKLYPVLGDAHNDLV